MKNKLSIAAVVSVLFFVQPGHADTQSQTSPFDWGDRQTVCHHYDPIDAYYGTVDESDLSACSFDVSADHGTGAIRAHARVTPSVYGPGELPFIETSAIASAWIGKNFDTSTEQSSVHVHATMRVDASSVGSFGCDSAGSLIVAYAWIDPDPSAQGWFSSNGPVVALAEPILTDDGTSPSQSVTGEEITLDGDLSAENGPITAGAHTLRIGFFSCATANVPNPTDATVSADAVVEGIAVS